GYRVPARGHRDRRVATVGRGGAVGERQVPGLATGVVEVPGDVLPLCRGEGRAGTGEEVVQQPAVVDRTGGGQRVGERDARDDPVHDARVLVGDRVLLDGTAGA